MYPLLLVITLVEFELWNNWVPTAVELVSYEVVLETVPIIMEVSGCPIGIILKPIFLFFGVEI